MSPKLKQALSLLVSTTLLLSQSSITTYAINTDSNQNKENHSEIGNNTDEILGNVDINAQGQANEDNSTTDQDHTTEDNSTTDQDQSTEDDSTINQDQLTEDNDIIDPNQITEADDIDNENIDLFAAVNPQVVYTQATKSNSDKSGNGSRSNPYNRFEDAVANVEDGGTIIIKSGQGAFLNTQDEYGKIPFIIDKNITIRSEDDSTMANFLVRSGGIILQGDVTFKNIVFQFSNKYHDSIFANGYDLEIINCERGSGSREVDLFAGSLYDKNTGSLTQGHIYDKNSNPQLVTPKVGGGASILLETSDKSIHSQFGKIFAGSMNGNFSGNVDIKIKDGGNLDFVSLHSSGAEEANPGSMFDLEEPEPPKEKPNDYMVNGTVNIELINHRTNISGTGATQAHVTIETEYPINYFSIEDVDSITVKSGTIIPDSISWKNGIGNLTISSQKSNLELSNIKDLTINHFTGGGILTLHKEGYLTINGNITGETTFQTVGSAMDNSHSGLVVNNHPYITSKANQGNENSFKFQPSPIQSGYKLKKVGSDWMTQGDSTIATLPESLSALDFITKESTLLVEHNDPNPIDITSAVLNFTLEPELSDESLIHDLPFELFISGKKADKKKMVDNNGEPYLYWSSNELGLEATLIGLGADDSGNPCFTIDVLPLLTPSGTLPASFKAGTYEVVLALPNYNLSTNTSLHVIENTPDTQGNKPSDSETQMTILVDNQVLNSQTPVQFNQKLTIKANVQPKANSPLPFAAQNEVDFVVNGQIIGSSPIINNMTTLNIDITPANHFIDGDNEIKLLFGGSSTLIGSTANQTIKVQKIQPKITLSPNINTIYDGKQHPLTATVDNLNDVAPTISYYTNDQYTGDKTNLPPSNVGTYYAEISLPGGDIYKGVTLKQGTVNITKATPEIVLSSTMVKNSDATTDLKVYATMKFPEFGSIPIGEIKFELTDNHNQQVATEKLSYGTTSHVFKNLSDGNYTITASYLPQIEGIEDPNYIAINNVQELIEVLNDFVSVEDVELISSEIQLSPEQTGMELPFTITPDNATNQAVVWESSNPSIVTVDPTTGKLNIKSKGTAIITVRTKDGNYSSSSQITIIENTGNHIPVQSISLDQSTALLDLNGTNTQLLTPTISPIDAANTNIIWKSKNDDIATVDDLGNITAKAVGRTTILAVTKDGAKVATCDVQVIDSQQPDIKVTGITLSENHLTLEKEQRKMLIPTITPLDASDKEISWTSSHPDVAEVTESGTVIAKSIGNATITATALDGSGITATSMVTVIDAPTPPGEIAVTNITLDKPTLSLLKGESAPLKATIAPLNATNKNVVWKSDDESIATVTADGVVTAKSAGTTTITATALGGNNVTATSKVTVTENTTPPEKIPVTGVKLDRQKMTLKEGRRYSLTATVAPYNATNKEVTWKSSNPSIASVDQNGNITARAKGYTTITVTTRDGRFTASCDITVTSSSNSNSGNNGGGSGSNNSSNNNSSNNNNTSTNKEEQTPVTPKPNESTTETTPNQPVPTVTQFQDVTDNWAKNDIQFVIERGLFQGLSETKFGVNSPMTRGMIVTVLHRLANTPQVGSATFSDVKSGTFYADAISWATTVGIVSGIGSGQFAPNQNVTREQLAVMFYQYAKILDLTSESTLTKETSFKDANQVSNWSKDAIQWAVDEGIILGNPDGTLNPKGVATRAQVASITRRFVELTEKLQ